MKKIILASAIVSALAAGSAFAAQNNNVTFVGSVVEATCDLEVTGPDVKGIDVVLGQVEADATNSGVNKSAETPFSIKPAPGKACNAPAASNNVNIQWSGNLGDKGLTSAAGATDAYVTVYTVGGTADGTAVSKAASVSSFAKAKLNDPDGLTFKAQLVAGSKVGAFNSPAAYTISYN
ncbi:TPA: hypothetical protein H1V70_004462 [Salmonella enterica]|nr:hypothetical protein [Salmonella enterica]